VEVLDAQFHLVKRLAFVVGQAVALGVPLHDV
jgi:hypothetical protein